MTWSLSVTDPSQINFQWIQMWTNNYTYYYTIPYQFGTYNMVNGQWYSKTVPLSDWSAGEQHRFDETPTIPWT